MSTAVALARKQVRHTRNLGRIIRAQSRFKWLVVLGFAVFLEGGLGYLFLDAFRFLNKFGGTGVMVINRLFALFFLGTGLMLVMSSLVTSYATVFRSEEIPFLLVRPFRISEIVVYKFIESTLLSSWAYFFIVVPFVVAYAWHNRLSPLFGVWTLVMSLPYLLICSGLGTVVVMACVRWVPRGRWFKRLLLAVCAVAVVWGMVAARGAVRPEEGGDFSIARLVPGLRLSSSLIMPSAWVSEGIMSLTRGEWSRGGLFWLALVSTAGAVTILVEGVGGCLFYEAWQRVAGSRADNRRAAVLLPGLRRGVAFLPRDVRAMVLKDVRTFFRDPMQWSQALVFFGLLAIYFFNLRSLHYDALPDHWRNMIAFLNVFSVSAVICSFGSRFVYPQLSLEGHGFWIVGLSPTTLRRVVMTKFFASVVSMMSVGVVLTLLSTSMLRMGWGLRAVALVVVASITLAVCGLSTGLGAIFMDLKERNPAAIVSGFGGTLNLVLSLSVMLLAIIPTGLLYHLHSIGKLTSRELFHGMFFATGWLGLVTAFAAFVPLAMGIRGLQGRDF